MTKTERHQIAKAINTAVEHSISGEDLKQMNPEAFQAFCESIASNVLCVIQKSDPTLEYEAFLRECGV